MRCKTLGFSSGSSYLSSYQMISGASLTNYKTRIRHNSTIVVKKLKLATFFQSDWPD